MFDSSFTLAFAFVATLTKFLNFLRYLFIPLFFIVVFAEVIATIDHADAEHDADYDGAGGLPISLVSSRVFIITVGAIVEIISISIVVSNQIQIRIISYC